MPLGLLWGHLAPHPLYSPSGHQLNLVVGDAKPLVRADGLFLLITGVAGSCRASLRSSLARRAEIGATLGLALGGLAAGWLAWRVGHAWTGGLQPIQLALKPDDTKASSPPTSARGWCWSAGPSPRSPCTACCTRSPGRPSPSRNRPRAGPVQTPDTTWPAPSGPPLTES